MDIKNNNLFGRLIIIAAIVPLCVALFSFASFTVGSLREMKEIESIQRGYVCDKTIMEGGGMIFARRTIYRVFVEGEYRYKDSEKLATVYFDVPEEVYQTYEVGGYFDVSDYSPEPIRAMIFW